MRKIYIVGNWKLNKTPEETVQFCRELKSNLKKVPEGMVVGISPTHLALESAIREMKGSGMLVGAQSGYWEASGAFTGQVSMSMIKAVGADFCLIGHSEQRQFFGESDESVKKRTETALAIGVLPIVCVGETLQERETGKTDAVLERQIRQGLTGVKITSGCQLVVAYEPVWAIGTGKTATPEMAQDAHAYCRRMLAKVFSGPIAEEISIQYGGSVKPDNAKILLAQQDIDGCLIGGASLKLDSFLGIINA